MASGGAGEDEGTVAGDVSVPTDLSPGAMFDSKVQELGRLYGRRPFSATRRIKYAGHGAGGGGGGSGGGGGGGGGGRGVGK